MCFEIHLPDRYIKPLGACVFIFVVKENDQECWNAIKAVSVRK
jgi:hypothetical protein